MSIDASTKATGIAVWVNGALSSTPLLDYGKIKDTDERIATMSKDIFRTLDLYCPSIVYVEDNYVGRNPKTQKELCRIQGVVFGWCMLRNSYFETMTPSAWRKYIPGFPKKCKREEAKAYSVDYVQKNYGFTCSDDIADAVLIGEAMLRKYE